MVFAFGVNCRAGGEDGVYVSGEQEARQGGVTVAGEVAEGVSAGVDLDVFQVQIAEAFAEPCGAVAFVKWRRSDLDQLGLPVHDSGFLEMKPLEGFVNRAQAGEVDHSRECRCSFHVVHEFLKRSIGGPGLKVKRAKRHCQGG